MPGELLHVAQTAAGLDTAPCRLVDEGAPAGMAGCPRETKLSIWLLAFAIWISIAVLCAAEVALDG